ncbi:MAG: PAS domain-containing protein, partial [Halanaerobiales bacterium]
MDILETKLKSRIAEALPVGLIITDKDVNILFVNEEFEKITGWTLEEVRGKNPRILSSGKMTDQYYERLWATVLSGGTWHERIVNKKKDGSIYYALQKITNIKEKDETIGFIAVQEDITEDILREEKYKKNVDLY